MHKRKLHNRDIKEEFAQFGGRCDKAYTQSTYALTSGRERKRLSGIERVEKYWVAVFDWKREKWSRNCLQEPNSMTKLQVASAINEWQSNGISNEMESWQQPNRANEKLKKFVKSRGRPFKYVVIVCVCRTQYGICLRANIELDQSSVFIWCSQFSYSDFLCAPL